MPKGIMSWFFVEADEDNKQETSGKEKKIQEAEAAPPSSETLKEHQMGKKGTVSRKFVDILFKALRKNDLEGFDYMEFKKSLQSLKKMDMPIETRLQSAYAMAETMGANKEHLLQTAEHYLKVLQQEEQKFEQALEKQQSKQIETKKGQLSQLNHSIKKKLAQIEKLEAEVTQHKEQINNLQTEIKGAATSIANTKNDFIASYNSLVNQIKLDMKHIEDYIK